MRPIYAWSAAMTGQSWNGRGHFFSAAAEAMRRILVENARRKRRDRHGGGRDRIDLDRVDLAADEAPDDLLALNEALDALADQEPTVAQVVKLRYFAGLTIEETASVLRRFGSNGQPPLGLCPCLALSTVDGLLIQRPIEKLSLAVARVAPGRRTVLGKDQLRKAGSMGTRERGVKAVFDEAAEIDNLEARGAFLDRACAGDLELRRKVELLLEAYQNAGSFMERPAIEAAIARTPGPADLSPGEAARPLAEGPGTRIGPYKLLHRIGEGGMGVVYMAEQDKPVRRTVALKIIKPGMDSAQVIARFEAERQALAILDHQNIARVLDAGTTDSGRPYFVMELVHGVPITSYCDDNQLTAGAAA